MIVEFWKSTNGYACCAKIKGKWHFVGNSRSDWAEFHVFMEAQGAEKFVRVKGTPRKIAEAWAKDGVTVASLRRNLPLLDVRMPEPGREFEFVLEFPVPSKKNRYRIHQRGTRRWIGKAEDVVNAEIAVGLIAKTALPKDLRTPISVTMLVQQSKSRKRLQDGDNLVGVIFDGLVKSGRIPGDSLAVIPEHHVYFVGREKDEVRVQVVELV